jgi:DNA repair photolyase
MEKAPPPHLAWKTNCCYFTIITIKNETNMTVKPGSKDSPPGTVRIREVECRSLLNKSGLADYAVNCYAGCSHGCRYCYARFATRYSHPGESWGDFVDVKINAPTILEKELKRRRTGRVFMSSVCDGWQPAESRYGLSGQCLEMLIRRGFPVTILTKSGLILRDLGLLAGKPDVELGVTVTTLNEALRKHIEPAGAPAENRFHVLEEAHRRGIETYAFVGPLMPGLTDTEENLAGLLKAIREAGVDYFYLDRLNPRFGVWPDVKALLEKHHPHLVDHCRRILFSAPDREAYTRHLALMSRRVAGKQGIEDRMTLCF